MSNGFISHRTEVLAALRTQALRGLEICGGKAESYAKENCPVDTGMLRNSIAHKVIDDSKEPAAYIGTNTEYAAYVELGTGTYYSGGRQTPWSYQDSSGNWHHTNGQKAQPYLKPAVADHASEYINIIKTELKGE